MRVCVRVCLRGRRVRVRVRVRRISEYADINNNTTQTTHTHNNHIHIHIHQLRDPDQSLKNFILQLDPNGPNKSSMLPKLIGKRASVSEELDMSLL